MMSKIIYNVTISLDKEIEQDWVKWMKEIHLKEVMQTGMFLEYRFTKVLTAEEDGISYSVQYMANNMKDYERYRDEFAPLLQKKGLEKFPGKFAAFRTLLALID
jgi:hypothetical protein